MIIWRWSDPWRQPFHWNSSWWGPVSGHNRQWGPNWSRRSALYVELSAFIANRKKQRHKNDLVLPNSKSLRFLTRKRTLQGMTTYIVHATETNKKISSLRQTDDPERSSYKSGASLFRSVERSRARCNCLIQNCFHECSQMLLLKYYAVKFYSFRAIGKVPACSRFWTSGTYVQSAVLDRAATRRELTRFGNQRHLPLQHLKSTRQKRVL